MKLDENQQKIQAPIAQQIQPGFGWSLEARWHYDRPEAGGTGRLDAGGVLLCVGKKSIWDSATVESTHIRYIKS